MATAMTQLGCSITHAAQIASECTQFSQETVRRWANCYFVGLHDRFVASPENVTDEDIEEELSSERGQLHPALFTMKPFNWQPGLLCVSMLT